MIAFVDMFILMRQLLLRKFIMLEVDFSRDCDLELKEYFKGLWYR